MIALDLDRASINGAIERFSLLVEGANVAIVYYSGDGCSSTARTTCCPRTQIWKPRRT
ncbi:hypothetical protein [Bradyrhizobium japonicum]|uniref:hypothetical protein n=1 Tax=Bradyrhizobium japonicum TaxID=375 RepID=UPI0035DC6575